MITLFTIGFTKKSAEQFFNLLRTNPVNRSLISVSAMAVSWRASPKEKIWNSLSKRSATFHTSISRISHRPRSCSTSGISRKCLGKNMRTSMMHCCVIGIFYASMVSSSLTVHVSSVVKKRPRTAIGVCWPNTCKSIRPRK